MYYHSDGSGRDNYIEVNSGGLNYIHKHLEYREAFKKSLRSIDRPQSAYAKYGGKEVGLRKTSSVSLLSKHQSQPSQRIELIKSQYNFGSKFNRAQSDLKSYQDHLDARLSQPKFQRPKIMDKKYLRKSVGDASGFYKPVRK